MREFIDATAFCNAILAANAALEEHKQVINELNVFPVPDGDTGTNMSLTMSTAAQELSRREFTSIDAAADCAASALLRGARGNSGVILSLLFRGIAKRLRGHDKADAVLFAGAMTDGVDAAYNAVMKPAEGTILTVSRVATSSAADYAEKDPDIEKMLECAVESAKEALADTINLNPVLARAGVVDAGGQGYVVILEAALAVIQGKTVAKTVAASADSGEHSAFAEFSTEEITFAYDTVFIVRKDPSAPELRRYRAYLDTIGDSIVIGEDDDCFKVHVHTNIPGAALTEAEKYGTLELAKIENMRTQHDELVSGAAPTTADDCGDDGDTIARPEKKFGVVAVCAGDGMAKIFRELGADSIVTGGQTMNPSTDDILRAINRTPAETVLVFPNNKNIIMAAEQCVPLAEKQVIVVPSKTVPQGVSALLCFDENVGADEMTAAMSEAMDEVHTAQITYAARDSDFDGHAIHSGEYLALLDGKLVGNYTNLDTCFKELSWAFDELSPGLISVYYGENVTGEDAQKAADMLSDCFPDAEVSVVNGGQPVYYYLISVE